jgi:ribosomal protein S18 acetylase RimI-like enzyme
VPKTKPEPAPDSLKREKAGTYRSVDGRFAVEQSSSGWMVLDAEQTDGLGLPLARGPFGTLDDAKAAMSEARAGGAPRPLPPKLTLVRSTPSTEGPALPTSEPKPGKPAARPTPVAARRPTPSKPTPQPRSATRPIVIRDLRAADGDSLRKLWKDAELVSVGDDDRSLMRMVRRNPGLVLVAVEGTRIVASALGGWDGRRGWIYHVATAASHRRQGIASRLLDQIEAALAVLGAPKVNAMVEDANEGGRAFWDARGYVRGTSTRYGKEL